jgi:hypothetical protein
VWLRGAQALHVGDAEEEVGKELVWNLWMATLRERESSVTGSDFASSVLANSGWGVSLGARNWHGLGAAGRFVKAWGLNAAAVLVASLDLLLKLDLTRRTTIEV